MTVRTPASLKLYACLAGLAAALAPVWLRRRARRGKEDPGRWPERLGRTDRTRPVGALIWLHGVSVGEGLSLLPLVDRLRVERPEATIVVTTGTRASAEVLEVRLGHKAIHQYAPLDTPGAARRFLDHWRPDLGVFVESELWPNLILAAKARGVRLALTSARLSERSAINWRRAPGAARAVLGAFDLILARDQAAAGRFARLGARVEGLADLKFGAPSLPVDPAELAKSRRLVGERPVLLAASTHPGEEALVLAAFRAARRDDRPLLIIAPRHPDRGEAIERLALDMGLAVSRRATGGALGDGAVYVADTVGELGLWYRLASLAVMGGSLAPGVAGGHNPLEPARLGCPFITGPGVRDWPVYELLEAAAATERSPPEQLAGWFSRAIAGPATLRPMAARAEAFVLAGDAAAGAATDKVIGLLAP